MPSGSVAPNSDISNGWSTSPGGPLSTVTNDSNGGTYGFAWLNNQQATLGFTIPSFTTGNGLTSLVFSWSLSQSGSVGSVGIGRILDANSNILASGSGVSGTATWTPLWPLTQIEYDTFAPRVQILRSGADSIPGGGTGGGQLNANDGAFSINWVTGTLPMRGLAMIL